MERFFDGTVAVLNRLVVHLSTFGVAVVLCTWASALIGAIITYQRRRDTQPRSMSGFLQFCFPSVILRHKSCRLDVLYVGVGKLIHPILVLPLMVSNVFVAEAVYAGLSALFGAQPMNPEPWLLWLAILIVAMVVQDFMTFYLHYLMHRIPVLWELHKVHHAAEFLLPITNRRFHPVQMVFDNFGNMLAVGLLLGASSYAFKLPVHDNSIIGLDAYFLLNIFSFYHLRHSHIPMSYGKRIELHVMSPKQHQLHHSRAAQHWDRNFGLFLSCWDRIFGTLAVPDPYEEFDLGLPLDAQHEYNSLAGLYFTPVLKVAQMALRELSRALPGTAIANSIPAPSHLADQTSSSEAARDDLSSVLLHSGAESANPSVG